MSQQNQGATAKDAVALLTTDHDKVKKLFHEFEKCDASHQGLKHDLAQQICMDLTIHATIEEEIFYPQVRAAINDDALLDEAEVEHSTAKDLIAQISGMDPEDDLYDARVTVLGEYIDHHVKEEREEMFPKARKTDLDLVAMAEELSQRKLELMEEFKAAHA